MGDDQADTPEEEHEGLAKEAQEVLGDLDGLEGGEGRHVADSCAGAVRATQCMFTLTLYSWLHDQIGWPSILAILSLKVNELMDRPLLVAHNKYTIVRSSLGT